MSIRRAAVSSFMILSLCIGTLLLGPATNALALSQNADSTWTTNGYVFATAQFGNVLFIGGTFTQVRTLPPATPGGTIVHVENLAAIDMTTGAAIASFHPLVSETEFAAGKKAGVQALAVVGDTLYVGGQFNTIDAQTHDNLAAIHIDPSALTGTVDPTFTPVIGVPGSPNQDLTFVYKILPGPGGLYVAGAFTMVGTYLSSKIVELNFDGTVDTAFRTNGVNGAVRDMAFSADGQTIFAVGAFGVFNGASRQSIVRISAATGANDAWAIPSGQVIVGSPSAPHPNVMTCWSVAVTSTRLYVGCGRTPNYAAAFRLDNGNSGDRAWLYSSSGNIQAVALSADGLSLYIGGHFGTNGLNQTVSCPGGTKYLKNLAILHNITGFSTPTADCNFVPQFEGPSPNGGVWEIQVTATSLWVGGMFRTINGVNQWGIARFTL
jgi:Domain of unknown function (DUF5122) beta-propeller